MTFSERAVTAAAGVYETFLRPAQRVYPASSGGVAKLSASRSCQPHIPTSMDEALAVLDAIPATPSTGTSPWDTETTSLRPEASNPAHRVLFFVDVGVATYHPFYDHPHAPPEYFGAAPQNSVPIVSSRHSALRASTGTSSTARGRCKFRSSSSTRGAVHPPWGAPPRRGQEGNEGLEGADHRLVAVLRATKTVCTTSSKDGRGPLACRREDRYTVCRVRGLRREPEEHKKDYQAYLRRRPHGDIEDAAYQAALRESMPVNAKSTKTHCRGTPKRPKKPQSLCSKEVHRDRRGVRSVHRRSTGV